MRFYKQILVFFISIFSFTICFAQEDVNAVKVADEMYSYGDKKDALEVYIQALHINRDNIRANLMAGVCYLETINKDKSVPYLLKAFDLQSDVTYDILYLIARGYHLGNNFDDALSYYNNYKKELELGSIKDPKLSKEDALKRVLRRIDECNIGKELVSNPVVSQLTSIGSFINSDYAEYAPVITPDEKMMIFTSRRQGSTGNKKDRDNEFFEDIYYSDHKEGDWTTPKNIGPPINTEFHDGCIALSADAKELYIYKEENGGDIYVSEQNQKGEWQEPKPVRGKVNSSYYEPSICVSQDKKTLFFASNRPGGKGGLDLYKCTGTGKGSWNSPELLEFLNTEYNEESPYYDQTTRTLYFSSAGHKGMGGYDIFKTVWDSVANKWSEPVNLGYPINTSDDDIYYVVSAGGERGYYSSVREGGLGEKDIYVVELPKVITKVTTPTNKNTHLKKTSPSVEETLKVMSSDSSLVEITVPIDSTGISKIYKRKKDAKLIVVYKSGDTKTVTESVFLTENIKVNNPKVDEKKSGIDKNYKSQIDNNSKNKNDKLNPSENQNSKIAKVDKNSKIINTKSTDEPKDPVLRLKSSSICIIKGVITDENNDGTVSATIQVTNSKGKVISLVAASHDGTYEVEVPNPKDNEIYTVTAKKGGFMYSINKVKYNSASSSYVVNMELSELVEGAKIRLRNLYYRYGSDELIEESTFELEKLERLLTENPRMKIEIGGHTDDIGARVYNKQLSQKRVDGVVRYLVKKGVDPARLKAVGYGEDKPLATNDDEEEGRELNRRTEFKVLKH